MGVRNGILGGSDYSDGEVLYAADMNDTNDAIITTYRTTLDQKYGDSVITGCLVEEQGTPDQTVQVSSGTVLINGQTYSVSADASVSLSAADATNPRWDIISVGNDDTITVTDGTAAATPVVPSLPTDHSPLAVVYRAANDNTIQTADIKDCRRLIDRPYLYGKTSESSRTSAGTTTVSIVTIPAFRVQKYLTITFDISTLHSNDPFGYNQVGQLSSYGQLNLNDSSENLLRPRFSAYGEGGASQENEWVDSTSVSRSLTFTSDDLDFTQPIKIDLLLVCSEVDGNPLYIYNNMFNIKGE